MSPSDPVGKQGILRRLLVGYDGSPASRRAVQFALGVLRLSDGELWLVHVADPPRSVAEPRTDEEQGAGALALEQSLRAIQTSVDPTGQTVHYRVHEGAPPTVLLAVAAEVDADLIVLGTRGLRGPSRLLLGSVSQSVVAQSSRPVTVVP